VRLLLEAAAASTDEGAEMTRLVDRDAEALLASALTHGDAFLRTVVLEMAPAAFYGLPPATAAAALGAAVDCGDSNLLSFLLDDPSRRALVAPEAQDAIDLAAWGDFEMVMKLHEVYDLPALVGGSGEEAAAFDAVVQRNFGVAAAMRSLMAAELDALLLRDARWAARAAAAFERAADAPGGSEDGGASLTEAAFVDAVAANVPGLLRDAFRGDEAHQRQFLSAVFARCQGIDGTPPDPVTGAPRHMTARVFEAAYVKACFMQRGLAHLRANA
jgi:hypothetical protein